MEKGRIGTTGRLELRRFRRTKADPSTLRRASWDGAIVPLLAPVIEQSVFGAGVLDLIAEPAEGQLEEGQTVDRAKGGRPQFAKEPMSFRRKKGLVKTDAKGAIMVAPPRIAALESLLSRIATRNRHLIRGAPLLGGRGLSN